MFVPPPLIQIGALPVHLPFTTPPQQSVNPVTLVTVIPEVINEAGERDIPSVLFEFLFLVVEIDIASVLFESLFLVHELMHAIIATIVHVRHIMLADR
jgi:hypothetical protein